MDRLTVLRNESSEIENELRDIYERKFKIEGEITTLKVKGLLESGLLKKTAWRLSAYENPARSVNAWAVDSIDEIVDIFSWEHDSLEINEKVSIGCADGDLYLRGNIVDLLNFIKSNDLVIELTEVLNTIESLKKELESLQQFVDSVSK